MPPQHNGRNFLNMFSHPFSYVMVATFLGALLTMLAGVGGMAAGTDKAAAHRANRLMMLRVGLCGLLLAEILIYVTYIRP